MSDNFQDNVSYGNSTLAVSGDAIAVGTSPGVKSIIFNNSDSAGHLVWQPNANVTLSIPANGGTIQTVGQAPGAIAAGTQTGLTGTIVFSNSNNITFGMSNSSIVTASFLQSIQTQSLIAGVYDGANSITTGTIRFSNSNGVSFGINGQTLTASHNGITSQSNQTEGSYAIGNTTGQSSSSTFDARTMSISGVGNISVGYSNNALIISGAGGAGGGIGLAADTETATSGTVVFSNSNGISFGMSNSSVVTASYTVPTQTNQTVGLYAVSNTTGQSSSTTVDARSLSFQGAGVASVGYTNGSVVISVPSGGGGITNINVSAGTTSNNLSALTFSNSNGIGFGLNGSVITASYTTPTQTNQTVGLYALGNTTQNSSTTLDARTLSYNGIGGATIGYSNGSIQVSVPATSSLVVAGLVTISSNANTITIGGAMNFSAGTTSNNLTAVTLSNSNNVSFGLNGSTVTASFGQTNQTIGLYAVSNTTQNSSTTLDARTLSFQGAGNISIGYSNGSIVVSGSGGGGGVALSAGANSTSTGTVVFSNSNNITFGMSNNGVVTASFNANNTASTFVLGISTQGNTAGTTGFANQSVQLVGTNNIQLSQSINGNSATISIGNIFESRYVNEPSITNAGAVIGNSLVSVFPIFIPYALSASNLRFGQSISVTSAANASTAFLDLSMSAVVYTLNGSTLSSVASGSNTYVGTWSSNATSSITGARGISLSLNNAIFSPGEYWIAMHVSTTNTATGGANTTALGNTISMMIGVSAGSAALGLDPFGVATASSRGASIALGLISTGATRASIAVSDVTQTGTRAMAAKLWMDLRNYTIW